MHPAGWIDDATWAAVQAAVPILCVDMVPVPAGGGEDRVGLIRRDAPFPGGSRWCHLGGRVRHGETVRDGLLRHLRETLRDVDVRFVADPQPDFVFQWFPEAISPSRDGVRYGWDPRQHAVSLCFRIELADDVRVVPGGEGGEFAWFLRSELTERESELWPGTRALVEGVLDW